METVIILIVGAIFASMVGSRAASLNRDSWAWGIAAFIISPLLVWITLEIVGRKKVKVLEAEPETENNSIEDVEVLQLESEHE